MSSKSMSAEETLNHATEMAKKKKAEQDAEKIANENRVERQTFKPSASIYSLPTGKYSENYDKIDWSK